MDAIEQQILEKVSRLEPEQKQRVLEYVEHLAVPKQHYTASELMRLPLAEREAVLRLQLSQAVNEDFETIEAYSEEDLDAIP